MSLFGEEDDLSRWLTQAEGIIARDAPSAAELEEAADLLDTAKTERKARSDPAIKARIASLVKQLETLMGERRSAAVKRRTGLEEDEDGDTDDEAATAADVAADEADEDDEDDEGDDDKAGALKYRGLLRANIDPLDDNYDSEGGGGEEDDERDDGQNYGYRSYSESEEE